MTHIRKYCLFILVIAFFAGCRKDTDSLSVSDFPVKVGDTWTFQRYDSLSLKTDTVVWSLPAIVSVNGKSMYLWVQTSSTQIDTGYWAVSGDTVTLWATIFQPSDWLIFPIQNGSSWLNNAYSCSVSGSRSVMGKNYNNVFVLKRSWGGYNAYGNEKIGIVKGIGIISYYIYEVDMAGGGVANYQLSLLSYSLH
jgi:hypothetical protein